MITPSVQSQQNPYVLKLVLPGLPKMTNAMGKSIHWKARMRERDQWKRLVVLVIGARHRPPKPLAKAKLTLTRHSTTQPDPDGLVSGFKASIDGLVHAGVLEDDKGKNIGMPTYQWEKAPQKKGFISMRVEEVRGE